MVKKGSRSPRRCKNRTLIGLKAFGGNYFVGNLWGKNRTLIGLKADGQCRKELRSSRVKIEP